jgi:large subunit ribosomal protein L30
VLINSANKGLMGMLWRVRHSVAYGEIDKETLVKLLNARGKVNGNKKINFNEAASELMSEKNLEELGFKPFFRLHPPRKGINSKLQYPKGVLGNNKNDINKLIERML